MIDILFLDDTAIINAVSGIRYNIEHLIYQLEKLIDTLDNI